jgi:hypothetical protein
MILNTNTSAFMCYEQHIAAGLIALAFYNVRYLFLCKVDNIFIYKVMPLRLNYLLLLLAGKDEDDIIQEKKLQKLDRKKYHKEQDVVMDEPLPKATGHEAMLEKKALRRQHARAREDSPELLKEKDVMWGKLEKKRPLATLQTHCFSQNNLPQIYYQPIHTTR